LKIFKRTFILIIDAININIITYGKELKNKADDALTLSFILGGDNFVNLLIDLHVNDNSITFLVVEN
jgi:GTP cyclohydrolase III